ncbi:MAG: hypothetical protein FJ280_30660 [Planctomycetes bacterium]|nr:hypothetical protein [Planctomycetota bacterium]
MRITRLAIAAFLAVSVGASVASGGAPMGVPQAFVGPGGWAIGGTYGREQMDLTASGTIQGLAAPQDFEIENLQSNMFLATLAYGLRENWDVYVLAGVANAADDIVVLAPPVEGGEVRDSFRGGYGLALGVGTRATFLREGPWSVGGLAQLSWFRPGDSRFTGPDPYLPDTTWVGNVDLSYWQVQASVAAAYDAGPWRFWAGPYLRFLQGNMDFDGNVVVTGLVDTTPLTWSSSFDDSFNVGAHFGARWKMNAEWNLWLEGQITGDSWLVGLGAVFVPERGFDM